MEALIIIQSILLVGLSVVLSVVLYKLKFKKFHVFRALKTSKDSVNFIVDNIMEDNKTTIKKIMENLTMLRESQSNFYTDEIAKLNTIVKSMNDNYSKSLREFEKRIEQARIEGKEDVLNKAKELEAKYIMLCNEYIVNIKKLRKDASILIALYNLINEQCIKIDMIYNTIKKLVNHYSEGTQMLLRLEDKIENSKKIIPLIEEELDKLSNTNIFIGVEESFQICDEKKRAVETQTPKKVNIQGR